MKNPRLYASVGAMLALGAFLVAALLWQLDFFRSHRSWLIATGREHGTYHALGVELAKSLNRDLGPYEEFRAVISDGSDENMRSLARESVHFAFAQSDATPAAQAKMVATLYDEVVLIAVRDDLKVSSIEDFGKLTVSIGPQGSGTRTVAEMILKHFDVQLESAGLEYATSELPAKFESGELDAAFLLAAPGARLAKDLFSSTNVRLVSLGDGPPGGGPTDAFAILEPAFRPKLIPTRLYGKQPKQPIHTIGVSALLLALESVDAEVVRSVTRHLFEHRNEPSQSIEIPLRLGDYKPGDHLFPYHDGAEGYYFRESPSLLIEYAEVISLAITVLVGIWSMSTLFLRWTADLKKERIDSFYSQVGATSDLAGAERLTTLRAIHKKSFEELMNERLAANESFVIFHDYLLSEISRAEREVRSERGSV